MWEVLRSSKVCGNGCLAFNGFFCCLRYHGEVCFVKPWFWKSNGFLKWLSDLSTMPEIQTAIIWPLADVRCVMLFVVSCTIENPNLFSYAVIFSHIGQSPVIQMVFAKLRSNYCNDHLLAFQALWNVLYFWNGLGTVEVQVVRVIHSIYTCGRRCLLFKANLTEIQYVDKGMTLTSPIVSSSWSWWGFYGSLSIPGLVRMLWCVFFLLFSLQLSFLFFFYADMLTCCQISTTLMAMSQFFS